MTPRAVQPLPLPELPEAVRPLFEPPPIEPDLGALRDAVERALACLRRIRREGFEPPPPEAVPLPEPAALPLPDQ